MASGAPPAGVMASGAPPAGVMASGAPPAGVMASGAPPAGVMASGAPPAGAAAGAAAGAGALPHRCAYGPCGALATKRCTACLGAFYCGEGHQRAHWASHRSGCAATRAAHEARLREARAHRDSLAVDLLAHGLSQHTPAVSEYRFGRLLLPDAPGDPPAPRVDAAGERATLPVARLVEAVPGRGRLARVPWWWVFVGGRAAAVGPDSWEIAVRAASAEAGAGGSPPSEPAARAALARMVHCPRCRAWTIEGGFVSLLLTLRNERADGDAATVEPGGGGGAGDAASGECGGGGGGSSSARGAVGGGDAATATEADGGGASAGPVHRVVCLWEFRLWCFKCAEELFEAAGCPLDHARLVDTTAAPMPSLAGVAHDVRDVLDAVCTAPFDKLQIVWPAA